MSRSYHEICPPDDRSFSRFFINVQSKYDHIHNWIQKLENIFLTGTQRLYIAVAYFLLTGEEFD